MPAVSVVMPVYNGERYLAAAIKSVLAQSFADFELIIVDDGSQDGSGEIIRRYQELDERIRLVRHERNQGIAKARNSGIAAARGELIAAHDSDDISLPERLRTQAAFLRARPEIAVISAFVQEVDKNLKPIADLKAPLDHAHIAMNLFFARPSLFQPSLLARREALMAAGGYDAKLKVADDTDLFVRLSERSRFANLPERLVLYRRHDRNDTKLRSQPYLDAGRAIRARWLNRLWGEGPGAAAVRLDRLRADGRFGWRDRRRLRHDLERLSAAFLATDSFIQADKTLLDEETGRLLESTTPRRWQMFLHWKRHHFGR